MRIRRLPHVVLLTFALCLAAAAPAGAATIVVDDAGDAQAVDGACTLREAIWVTNTNSLLPGAGAGDCPAGEDGPIRDVIEFDFGGTLTTIEPLALLPEISDPVEIDGSQGAVAKAAVRVEIDGSQVIGGVSSPGLLLHLDADGSSIHNLAVNEFPGDGITVYADEATLEYVIAGMDAGGTEGKGNGRNGITVQGARTTVLRSAASGNVQNGIEVSPLAAVSDGAENTIRGSRIGTNRAGTAAVGNGQDGVQLTLNTIEADADDLTIGGSEGLTPGGECTGDCNLISGNGGAGIEVRVSGEGPERTSGLEIRGNYVGTDVSGLLALGNGTSSSSGIRLFGATVGAAIADNVVSANVSEGITILAGGPGGVGATDTAITGNIIGLGSDGDTPLGNTTWGIRIDRSLTGGPAIAGTTIGGPGDPTPGGACDGDCNLISANGQTGILLFHALTFAGGAISETEIVGNYIGTDVTGSEDRGNGTWGMQLSGVSGTTVGNPGSPNVISGNGQSGVLLVAGGTSGNTIQSNLIGLAADGTTPLGNDEHGVDAGGNGNALNTIGGLGPGLGNAIAHNGKAGVAMIDGEDPVVDTPILGNSIFANDELGIDLRLEPLVGGVTENGACEEATGANRCQKFPVLTAAAGEGGGVAVAGTLASDPGKSYRVELFASAAADPSGNGEGERFLGAVTIGTDGSGSADFLFAATTATLAAGEFVSATATELGTGGEPLSTSEFSDALAGPVCDLEGGGGIDELNGGLAAEVICGFGAGDTLSGGGGRDAILAGEGDDTIDVADGDVDALVDCGPGNDTVSADAETTDAAAIFIGCETVNRPAPPAAPAPPLEAAPIAAPIAKVYKCKGKRATIVGSSKKETIKGTGKADVIVALGGNDTVKGRGGNDTICGGSGNDRLFGEKGNDRLDGGAGKDTLKGSAGNDRLKGAGGKPDLCDGGSGQKDRLDGKRSGCEKRKRIP